jgi:hypothetical protein
MAKPIKPSISGNLNQIAWPLAVGAIHIAITLSSLIVCPKLSGDSSPFGDWTS